MSRKIKRRGPGKPELCPHGNPQVVGEDAECGCRTIEDAPSPPAKVTQVSALALVRAAIKKAAGRAAIVSDIAHARSLVREVIAFGIPVLDNYVLACGGLPIGRVSEWYCAEGGGKSSLALRAIGQAQKIGTGMVALADDEQAMNEERARVFGADGSAAKLILIEPESTEESLAAQLAFLEAIPAGVGPNLLVWDSVAASIPDSEWADKDGRAALARAMAIPVKKIRSLLASKRCHWMVINQTREKMGVIFGDATTTPGGKQLKFAASHRIQLFPGKSLKDRTGQHVGRTITVLGTKNRFAPSYRKARIRLLYAHGFDTEWCVVDHAKTRGVLPAGTKVADGLDKALKVFGEHGWAYSPEPKGKKGAHERALAADEVEEEADDGLGD